MTVEHRTGDLFAQGFTAYAQGCNRSGVMGAGIAKEFRRRWPDMFDEYRELCWAKVLLPGEVHVWQDDAVTVFNLATQDRPGRYARLPWVRTAVGTMVRAATREGIAEIGLPRIGAGIGGLRWADVAEVLDEVAGGSRVRLVVMSLPADRTVELA